MNNNTPFVPFSTAGKMAINKSRRTFLKQSSMTAAAMCLAPSGIAAASAVSTAEQNAFNRLSANSIGFNGQRQDPVNGLYHLGNGYRVYNPGLMRFHAADSMSPFGKGGINSYAYALGDPINLRDPSGHFAILSLIIGAIVGAVVGAAISATTEGIRAAATGTSFDWKQVAIGAALGFISGGFGAAASGAKAGVQVGLAVADAVVSGSADFGLNVAAGTSLADAGKNAGIGAAIGLVTFGLGKGIGKGVSKINKKLVRRNNQIGFLLSPDKPPKLPGQPGASKAQHSFFGDAFSSMKNSFLGTSSVGTATDIPGRKVIQDGFKGISADEMSPFSKSLSMVNENLASHADPHLSVSKATAYLGDALKVNSGEVSNAYAHSRAAGRWIMSTDVPLGTRAVGATMNLAGAIATGFRDADNYKRGKF